MRSSAPREIDSLPELLERVEALLARPGRVVLGIAGPPGAGKSTLVETLLSRLGPDLGPDSVGHLPMDGFHLADVRLDRHGSRDRKGAPDTFDVDGYVATLERLHDRPDRTLYVPGFSRDLEQPVAAAIAIPPFCAVGADGGQLPALARRRMGARTPSAGRGVVRGRRR